MGDNSLSNHSYIYIMETHENGRLSSGNPNVPPPPPFLGVDKLGKWSLYRATITEFVATFLFLYVLVSTVIGYGHQSDFRNPPNGPCGGVGLQGIAWAVGGMIFVLVYVLLAFLVISLLHTFFLFL